LSAGSDAEDAKWFSLSSLPALAFDHASIVKYALQRLRWKFEYTTAGFALLPKEFTLNEIQNLYEIVFGKPFDKANFRKKILSLDILDELNIRKNVSHRPPKTYRLKIRVGDAAEII
jgi:8-oxo-dGTP diphosphatase